MRKYLRGITALIIAVAILSITTLASAAGTVTITGQWVAMDQSMYEVTITWTGDASSGAVPDTAFGVGVMRDIRGLYAGCAETDPGSTKPTDDYDITIVDEYALIFMAAHWATATKQAQNRRIRKLYHQGYMAPGRSAAS